MRRIVRNRLVPFLVAAGVIALAVLINSSPDRLTEAESLVQEWRLEEAQSILEEIFPLDSSDEAVQRLYAHVLLARGELARANRLYRRLATLRSENPHYLTELGFSYFYLGELDSALALSERALTLASGIRDAASVARAENLRGLIYFNIARYDSAALFQQSSLDAARRSGSTAHEADALRQLGVLAWYDGRMSEAMEWYESALVLYRAANDKIGEATTISNMGLLHNDRGDRLTAMRLQLEAFDMRRKIGDQRGMADSYYFLAFAPPGVHSDAFAYAYRLKSRELSARIGYAWGHDVAARSLNQLGNLELAFSQDEHALEDSTFTRSVEGRIFILWQRASWLLERKELEKLIPVLQRVIEECPRGYEISKRLAIRYCAKALIELRRYREAETLMQQDVGEEVDLTLDRNLVLSRLYVRTGRNHLARQLLNRLAAKSDSLYLHEIRNSSAGFERAAAMLYKWRSETYNLLVESLQREPIELIFDAIERERALPFWTGSGGNNEVENRRTIARFVNLFRQYDNSSQDAAKFNELLLALGGIHQSAIFRKRAAEPPVFLAETSEVPKLSDVVHVLQPGEVLVEYYILEDGILVTAMRKQRQTVRLLRMKPTDIMSASEVLKETILRGKKNPDDEAWKGPSRFLYSQLLEPLERAGLIAPGDQLIIAPHRWLNSVPFHALLVEKENREAFVAEHHTVNYVPSLAWFVRSRQGPSPPARSMLSVAPSVKSLPFALKEIASVPAHLFPERKQLIGPYATYSSFIAEMGQFDVLHIASHTRIHPSFPLYSTIELFDRGFPLYELFLRHPRPARLVVLSACETGSPAGQSTNPFREKDYAFGSEEIVSFPRALLQTGVPTVLASLWLVEDESTADLMAKFYRFLGAGESLRVAKSLNSAQNALLARSRASGVKSHPFYWAAFQVVGDGR